MSRSERFANEREIMKAMQDYTAGPVMKAKAGKYQVEGSEGHSVIIGESGTGKTRRQINPMIINSITSAKKESWIVADPKGEISDSTIGFANDDYIIYKFDFRNLYKDGNTCWNPLAYPYELWISGTEENKFRAEQLVDDLAHVMYPIAPNTDPFWMTEARNLFEGAVYALFSYAKPEEVNLSSVFYLVQKGEARFGGSSYLKEFVELEGKNENVSMQLFSYVSTANDTRGGIRSSFLSKLSMATKSESVRNFLSNDDIHINGLEGDKPVLIYVVLPDETPIYEELAGVLISQLMNHYIYIAETKWGGKLPVRVNFCLDELGNIGRAIGNLPHLLSAGRSRNVRCHLCLQSLSQLDDVYGKSKATTILSNASVKIAFRTNNWDTLSELSRLCGEKEVVIDGKVKQQPLITPTQLGAMETGQALIMVAGRLKFVTWLPDYTEIFDESMYVRTKGYIGSKSRKKTQIFDLQEFVKGKKRAKLMSLVGESEKDKDDLPFSPFGGSFSNPEQSSIDVDDLVKKIDAKIEALEAEEKAEKEKKGKTSSSESDVKKKSKSKKPDKSATVVILNSDDKVKDVKAIRECMGWGLKEATEYYNEGVSGDIVELKGLSSETAHKLREKLEANGDLVIVKE